MQGDDAKHRRKLLFSPPIALSLLQPSLPVLATSVAAARDLSPLRSPLDLLRQDLEELHSRAKRCWPSEHQPDLALWLKGEILTVEAFCEEARPFRQAQEEFFRKQDRILGTCRLLDRRLGRLAPGESLTVHQAALDELELRVMELEAEDKSLRRIWKDLLHWLEGYLARLKRKIQEEAAARAQAAASQAAASQVAASTAARGATAPKRVRSRALVAKADLPVLSEVKATRQGYTVGTTEAVWSVCKRGHYIEARHLQLWVKRGLLDAVKLEGEGRQRLRFRQADLDAFVPPPP